MHSALREELVRSVEAFCRAVENTATDRADDLVAIRQTLVTLYSSALRIDQIPEPGVENLPFTSSAGEHEQLAIQLSSLTKPDLYFFCYEPFSDAPDPPVASSIASDLAEIYGDLKPGLQALHLDRSRWLNDVLWDWKFGFDTHWGDHAVDSIWAIHKLLRDRP